MLAVNTTGISNVLEPHAQCGAGIHRNGGRVCCDDCRRCMLNARARARRRVRHEPMNCAVCGRPFTPKRSDAVTCSNTCRQSLHRQRHQPAKKRSANVQE
jgi:predicted nucleic acid-binding Zn ribbon protein